MPTKNHNILLNRTFQYLGIILIVAAMGGGYWYWKQVQAGVNIQADQEGTLSSGLVGYWSFDGNDISGTTAYDRSGQGNNGTLTNSPTKTIGRVGQALNFDGTNDYVSVPYASSICPSYISVAMWVKFNSLTTNTVLGGATVDQMYLLGKRRASENDDAYVFYKSTDQKISFHVNSYLNSAQTKTSVVAGQWYHLVGMYDGSVIKIYLNGVLESVVAYAGGVISCDTSVSPNLIFGKRYSSATYDAYFNGFFDETRIYNRSLSANEVWGLYQLGNPDKVNSADSQIDSLEKGVVGYWKLDDASGTSASDASGNGNTGTLTNGPTWTTGQIGGATDFDGTDDYIEAPSSTRYDSSVGTWSFWAKADTIPGAHADSVLFRADSSSSVNGTNIYVNTAGRFGFQIKDGSGQVAGASDTTVTANDGLWHHVVLSWTMANGGMNRLYVDGRETATGVNTAAWNFSSQPLRFADASDAYWEIFDGKLDEVRVYNRNLSAEEVAKLYRTTAPDDPDTGLVGYWPFNGKDIVGTTAYDRSGKGNNGTLTNSPTKAIGRVGQALGFDGTDDYVKRNVADFRSSDTVGTFSAWVRGNGRIFSSTDESVDFYYLVITSSSGKLIIEKSDNDSWHKVSTTNSPLSSDDWHHVIVFSNGSSWGMYVDGVAQVLIVEQQDNDGDWFGDVANRDNFQIGSLIRSSGYEGGFNGSIDEVRIYNRVLSANEIWSLYQMGNPDKVNSADSQGDSLEKGMVGYWKLDDASGTSASDASGNSNTGTLTNGPTWTTGQIGGATDFDGTDDYVGISSSSLLNMTGDITLSAWVKPASLPSQYQEILFKGTSNPNRQYGIRITNTNNYQGVLYVGGTEYSVGGSSAAAAVLSTWTHVVLVRSGSTATLYLDGGSKATQTVSGALTSTTYDLAFGRMGSYLGEYFSGSLDEVRIYNRALSAEEVAKLYRTTTPDNPDTGLVGYWPFNGKDISGTTAYDRSGKGNNGTLTNGPTRAIGKVGQGMRFDGTDDYVQIADNDVFTPSGNFSVSQWVKADTLRVGDGESGRITTKGSAGLYEWAVYTYGDGTNANIRVTLWNTTSNPWLAVTGSTDVAVGNWYHVVMAFDQTADRINVYVNGSLDGTSTSVSGTQEPNGSAPVMIGTRADFSNYFFDGVIDEVRIYSRALSATEVTALYNAGR